MNPLVDHVPVLERVPGADTGPQQLRPLGGGPAVLQVRSRAAEVHVELRGNAHLQVGGVQPPLFQLQNQRTEFRGGRERTGCGWGRSRTQFLFVRALCSSFWCSSLPAPSWNFLTMSTVVLNSSCDAKGCTGEERRSQCEATSERPHAGPRVR